MGIKVSNMTSPKSGEAVPNQFIITTSLGTYFQSYSSIIAFRNNDGQIYLDQFYWDYSPVTGKYRNIFLGESIVETGKKIESGEYQLIDLNVQGVN